MEQQPRILVIDIETLPNLGYTWGLYDQNVIRFVKQSCIATFSAKWLGEKEMISRALPDYEGYKPGSYDDKALVADIWKLLDEADAAIAHNGDEFDFRICNARFIFHEMLPPSPYKTIDTKKVASRVARFNSNKLDDLGSLLGFGHKIKTDFDLWDGCINGDKKCWADMVRYNERDVLLLEKVYLRLLPYITTHPNFTHGDAVCPKCGSKNINWRGTQRAITRDYSRFQCQNCGGWGRTIKSTGKAIVQNVGQ